MPVQAHLRLLPARPAWVSARGGVSLALAGRGEGGIFMQYPLRVSDTHKRTDGHKRTNAHMRTNAYKMTDAHKRTDAQKRIDTQIDRRTQTDSHTKNR